MTIQKTYESGYKDAIEACIKIVTECKSATAIEINGRTHLLGVMMSNPAAAQDATSTTILNAIKSLVS